jgi:hypothetical protein
MAVTTITTLYTMVSYYKNLSLNILMSSISIASTYGHYEIVKLLLTHKLYVDTRTKNKSTALSYGYKKKIIFILIQLY